MPPVPMGKEKLEASRNLQAVRQGPIMVAREEAVDHPLAVAALVDGMQVSQLLLERRKGIVGR